jgi:hypothetical protein
MSRTSSFALFLLLAVVAATPLYGQATRAPYTEGSVWSLNFLRIKPGLQDDYFNIQRATTTRLLEEEKRQGLILSYHFISAPAATPQDWDLLVMIEYKNYAALDSLREKTEPLMARVFGGESERRTQSGRRSEVREIFGTKIGREFILRDSTAGGRISR